MDCGYHPVGSERVFLDGEWGSMDTCASAYGGFLSLMVGVLSYLLV